MNNYLSKLSLAFDLSQNPKTFFSFLFNSKKYSQKFKSNTLDTTSKVVDKYQVKISHKSFEISMRTYKGDIDIFYEIFWKKVYNIPHSYIDNVRTIIDLGAHIGFTSVFFALRFPNAKIFSVEANKDNFEILKFNTKTFSNISIQNKAIYPTDGEVFFESEGLSYNTKIGTSGEPTLAVSVNTLMAENNLTKIDLIKIDIEGAEKLLLKENTDWLKNTDRIIIEIHDPYKIENLKKDLEGFGFRIYEPSDGNGFKNIFATKLSV